MKNNNEENDLIKAMLESVNENGYNLYYASHELRNHHDIVLTAVKNNGYALKYASNKLQNNKDVVITAVKQNGLSIQDASDELRSDKEIILTAIKQNPYSLCYASDELKNDKELLILFTNTFYDKDNSNTELYEDCKFKLNLIREKEYLDNNIPINAKVTNKNRKF